jgi:hypothetical protein
VQRHSPGLVPLSRIYLADSPWELEVGLGGHGWTAGRREPGLCAVPQVIAIRSVEDAAANSVQ